MLLESFQFLLMEEFRQIKRFVLYIATGRFQFLQQTLHIVARLLNAYQQLVLPLAHSYENHKGQELFFHLVQNRHHLLGQNLSLTSELQGPFLAL